MTHYTKQKFNQT